MRRNINIVLWVTLLLQGCNFFYSTVDYKGKEAEPRLCVVSRLLPPSVGSAPARVDVLHSEFFLNTGRTDVPVLQDARVSLQVNSAAPVSLPYISDPDTIYSMSSTYMLSSSVLSGYFAAPVVFGARDTVRLQVHHPVYGSASAVQVCPAQQAFKLNIDSVSRYGEVWCHLHLEAYTGAKSDVLTLQAVTKPGDEDEFVTYVYTQDTCCERYDNMQVGAYYAGVQLHLPVAAVARDIPVVLDAHMPADSVQLTMYALTHTREDYDYQTSVERTLERDLYVPALSSIRESDAEAMGYTMQELFAQIAARFDVLGQAESYQVYGNLSGVNTLNVQPFGCFTLLNLSEQTLHYTRP